MDANATWRLTGDTIAIASDGLGCEADANSSPAGVHAVRLLGGPQIEATLLTVEAEAGAALPDAIESYVRGSDWVSTHPSIDGWPFRVQLSRSVRRLSGSGDSVATLTVSVQTPLLDTRPRLVIGSRVAGADFLLVDGGASTQAGGATLVAAAHPTDASECETLVDAEGGMTHTFAPDFLEKGVIRRARFCVLALSGEADSEAIDRAISAWAEAPLPLTA